MNILSLKVAQKTLWNISSSESGNYSDFDIEISSDANSLFLFRYHDVIDVRKSGIYLLDANKQPYSLEFIINVFLDTSNRNGLRQYQLQTKQHGLISLGAGISDRPNALFQLIENNNFKVLFASPSNGKVGLKS